MPVYEIDGNEVEVPEGMSMEEATKHWEASQYASEKAAEPVSPMPLPTATGGMPIAPSQSGAERLNVSMLRNVPPIAAAFVTRSPSSLALITGLSDLAAEELAERYESPEYKGGAEFLRRKGENVLAGGISAGASFAGDRFLLPWIRKGVQKLSHFALLPKQGRVRQAETGQGFLGRFAPVKGKPFSLTLDQLHQGQESLAEQLGSMARSGFFSGKIMRGADIRNQEVIDEFVDKIIATGSKTTPRKFGNMLATLLNKETGYIKFQKNAMFDQFREMAYDKGILVDLSEAFDFLKTQTNNRFARGVLAKVFRSNPQMARQIKGGTDLLLKSEPELEAFFASLSPDMANQFLERTANTLPLETAADLYHNLNRMFGKAKEGGIRNFSTEFKTRLDDALKRSLKISKTRIRAAAVKSKEGRVFEGRSHHEAMEALDEAGHTFDRNQDDLFITEDGMVFNRRTASELANQPDYDDAAELVGKTLEFDAYNMFRAANDFAARHGERLERKVIDGILKKIGDKKPGALLPMLSGPGGRDALPELRRLFATSDVLTLKDFQKTVLEPLRHHMLSTAIDGDTGLVSGAKLANMLDRIDASYGPEYANEVFGSGVPKAMREAATTLKTISATKEASIVMKILQAGALGTGLGAVAYGNSVDSETVRRIGLGTTAIILAPTAMAKIMANPKLIRTLTDGMMAGPGTNKFARAVMVAMTQNRRALADLAGMSSEAQDFYGNIPIDEADVPEERGGEPATTGLGDLPGTAGAFFPETPLQ